MVNIRLIPDFLLSSWLWAATFDLSHFILSALFILFGFWLILRRGFFASLAIALGLVILSFSLHTIFVVGFLVNLLHWQLSVAEFHLTTEHLFSSCFYLALLHAVVETLFFLIGALFFARCRPLFSSLIIIWLSNLLAAFLSYKGILLFMDYLF